MNVTFTITYLLTSLSALICGSLRTYRIKLWFISVDNLVMDSHLICPSLTVTAFTEQHVIQNIGTAVWPD